MRNFNKLFMIASSFASLLISNVYANKNATRIETTPENSQNERYYMVFIKSTNGLEKREDSTVPAVNTPKFINSMVSEIHSIIQDNKNTYVDKEKFNELKETHKLRKRNNKVKHTKLAENDNVDSPYVYPISSVDDSTILYAYLSENLVPQIENIDYVSSVHIGEYFDINRATKPIYSIEDIQKETGWGGVRVREDAYPQLALISQGQFQPRIIGSFDYHYYYPETAGEGINVVLLDTGFNFRSSEFSNQQERVTECVVEVKNAEIHEVPDKSICGSHETAGYHGEKVADMVGGLYGGVANKANIYGVSYDYKDGKVSEEDVFTALQYISENLVKANKTIINISSGKFYSISDMGDSGRHYQRLIRKLVDNGAIVISCAGNQGALAYNEKHDFQYLPCSFDDVICVGGIDNVIPLYQPDYILNEHSNSGTTVDIYAPFFVYTSYQNKDGVEITDELDYGTSFSTPLVSGVAALIMAEELAKNPDHSVFTPKSLLQNLTELGLKDIILYTDPNRDHNVFLNNGKSIVYSLDGKYAGCGRLSGFHTCANGYSCEEEEGLCINAEGDIDFIGRDTTYEDPEHPEDPKDPK
eukprot:jgi/Orpsp1_1/1189566/evm.model.d7180000072899.1